MGSSRNYEGGQGSCSSFLAIAIGGAVILAGLTLLPTWSLGDVARRFLPVISGYPWRYWLSASVAITALVMQVGLPFVAPQRCRTPQWWTSRATFVLLTVAAVLVPRWPAFAFIELNPDESLHLAGALTLSGDPRYWISTEGTTRGPLTEFVLLPVELLRMQLEYGSARLVALVLQLGCVFFLFGTLRTFFAERISRAGVTPLSICIALQTHPDFISYNAEYPAVFLLSAGAYGCARLAAGVERHGQAKAFMTGLALGLVPFAKLQGVPIALVLAFIALLCVLRGFWDRRRRQLLTSLALIAGGLTPTAIVLLYLSYYGILSHFWIAYIRMNLEYTQSTSMGKNVAEKAWFFLRWASEAWNGLFFEYFLITIAVGLLLIMAIIGIGSRSTRFLRPRPQRVRLLSAAGIVLLASVYSVVAPGIDFYHYLIFLVCPLAFLAGLVVAMLYEMYSGRVVRTVLVVAFLASALAVPSARRIEQGNSFLHHETRFDPYSRAVADLICKYASPGQKLVVWGWMDKYYILTGMRQGTLHCYSFLEINGPNADYFYPLYVSNIARTKPLVFVDAVGPHAFGFTDPSLFTHDNFPGLRERIAADFEQVGEINWTRVYVSKARLAELGVKTPLMVEVPFPVVPCVTTQLVWSDGTAVCSGSDSSLRFSLISPAFVHAIRLGFSREPGYLPADFGMRWADSSRNALADNERSLRLRLGEESQQRVLTIAINDTIDSFQINPDTKPCVFKLNRIDLLVRPEDQAGMMQENEK